MSTCEAKIEAANRALATFAKKSRIERRPNGFYVVWDRHSGGRMERRWQCRGGQDFYPVWSRQWPHGGTATTALSQLIRWLRGQPVLPLATWQYWSGERVKLCTAETVEILRAAGYPEVAQCVLCGIDLTGGLDWWNLNGVSGPCCSWTTGCRQKQPAAHLAQEASA